MSKDKKPKGEKFKRFQLAEGESAILLSFLRQVEHPNDKDELAYGIILTLEGQGKTPKSEEEKEKKILKYKDGADMIVSIEAHEYLPTLWSQCKPNGFMLKQWIGMKKAIANAEKVYDLELMKEGWKREDGLWFPGGEPSDETDEDESEEMDEVTVEETTESEEGIEKKEAAEPIPANV